MDGEEWKIGGVSPTPEDCQKFLRYQTRFIASLPIFQVLFEARIAAITPGGLIQIAAGWCGSYWVAREDLRVVELIAENPVN